MVVLLMSNFPKEAAPFYISLIMFLFDTFYVSFSEGIIYISQAGPQFSM